MKAIGNRLSLGKFWQMIQNAYGRSITLTATTFYTEAFAKNCAYKGHFILKVNDKEIFDYSKFTTADSTV